MGLLNKLKNALFEEEYVEVEEKPKKVKKDKPKEVEKIKEKPVAKKIILPGRKDEKVEELHEEELIDEDFEIRPKVEAKVSNSNDDLETEEEFHNSFKVMDDNDFKVDEEVNDNYEVPEIVKVLDNVEVPAKDDYEVEEHYNDYNDSSNNNYHETEEKKLYGGDVNTIKVHEYGGYEKKEERSFFKPSPIISPIYGILDKNYKKEDVVSKKEVRLASSYSRQRVSVDEVRNKAYGQLSDDIAREMDDELSEETKFVVENKNVDEDNILVDLSDEKDKPTVKEVTVGDAMEYFQDLGLEYNVDYVDATKDKTAKSDKEIVEDKNEEMEEQKPVTRRREIIINDYEDDKQNIMEIEEKNIPIEEEEEKNDVSDNVIEADDNLFDLIDSMYQESE